MKTNRILALALLSLSTLNLQFSTGFAQGTAFTYQGRLADGTNFANGSYDIQFTLVNANVGGMRVGGPLTNFAVNVNNGLFATTVDFGAGAFTGPARWLEIAVRTNGGGAFVTLSPRQAVLPTPYAMFAATATNVPWNALTGVPAGFADGTDDGATYSAGAGLNLSGSTFSIAPLGVANSMIAPLAVTFDKLAEASVGPSQLADFAVDNAKLAANAVVTSKIQDLAVTTPKLADAAVTSAKLSPQLSLGTTVTAGRLELRDAPSGLPAILLDGDSGFIHTIRASDGNESSRLSGPAFGELRLWDPNASLAVTPNVLLSAGNSTGASLNLRDANEALRVTLEANASAGGQLELVNHVDTPVVRLGHSGSGGRLLLHGASGNTNVALTIDGSGGQLRLRDELGILTGQFLSSASSGGRLTLHGATGGTRVDLLTDSSSGNGDLTLHRNDGQTGASLSGGGSLALYDSFGAAHVVLNAESQSSRINVRLGIGRLAAVHALEVEGDASKSTAGGWAANSDARIKTDVATVTNALETLERVRLVSFRYTDEYRSAHPGIADRRYLNVVAQEFAGVFPEYVRGSGDKLPTGTGEPILQVDTYPLTIYAAAAIQELNRKLIAEVQRQKAENTELRARLEKLERLVSEQVNGGAR